MFPKRLSDGYQAFLDGRFHNERKRYEKLAEIGQNPEILLIGCCDSRVSPEVIFDAGPGEMFVIRNVANLVPPYSPDAEYHGTSAAVEFAVRNLRVKHVIVIGHSNCGGAAALLRGPDGSLDFVSHWMEIAEPARVAAQREAARGLDEAQVLRCCEREVVKVSLTNLLTFPWLEERVRDGDLRLHGMYFDIRNGALEVLEQQTGRFVTLLDD